MSYRFMRVLVFFDLPVQTSEDMKNYRLFRKKILKNGFFMMQESVYCRMNREIVANGYLTQLGFFHDNMFNQFNLSCDLMEPFRILVDRYVYSSRFTAFSVEEKHKMLEILQQEIGINNTRQVLTNGIKIYVRSIFDAINEKDLSLITFYGL